MCSLLQDQGLDLCHQFGGQTVHRNLRRAHRLVAPQGKAPDFGQHALRCRLHFRRRGGQFFGLLAGGEGGFRHLADRHVDLRHAARLFLAGGVAFNDMKGTKDESRRVELKLVFYGVDERPEDAASYMGKFQDDPADRCRI